LASESGEEGKENALSSGKPCLFFVRWDKKKRSGEKTEKEQREVKRNNK
jgi:hypothetical protein